MTTTTTTTKSPTWAGLPLKDRSPEHIREALSGYPEETVAQFLRLHAYSIKECSGLTVIAHRTGIGSSILSQSFSGTYKGDINSIAERIEKFFWRLEQKEKYGGIRKFVMTRLAEVLFDVFEKTRVIRRIQVIRSPEQLGKTTAAKEYTHLNNSGRTVYVKLRGGSKNPITDFVRELAQAVDVPYTIKLADMKLRIREKLESCDLIIIDEAHLATNWPTRQQEDFWDYLRTDLHEDGDRGIVLIATNHDMLANLKRLRKGGYNIGQLLGRTRNETIEIDPAEDIVEHDVFMLTARYYTPGNATITMLHNIASRPGLGHFGLINDILNEAWTTAKAEGRELADRDVESTARRIMKTLESNKELYA